MALGDLAGMVQPKAEYCLRGNNPEVLLLTVIHGDEKEVRKSVEQTLRSELYQKTNYMFIPEVSPSAAQAGTRENVQGVDLNRSFNDKTNPEVIRLQNMLE